MDDCYDDNCRDNPDNGDDRDDGDYAMGNSNYGNHCDIRHNRSDAGNNYSHDIATDRAIIFDADHHSDREYLCFNGSDARS